MPWLTMDIEFMRERQRSVTTPTRSGADSPQAHQSRCPYGVKFAVTVRSPFSGTVMTQVMPLHEPVNPVNVEPELAIGISVTVEPTGKMARQIPLFTPFAIEQATPPGELETEPFPEPAPDRMVMDPGTARR